MKRAGGLIGIVIALAIGYYVYRAQLAPAPGSSGPPQQQIDTTGVTADLLSIGQAERLYLASHGNYGSLDQLQADGGITFTGVNRRGYTFTADLDDGQHFTITATPADPSEAGWPTLSIDETMQVNRK